MGLAGPLGVAIVGAGYWGSNLIRNFMTLEDCRVVKVVDIDSARLEAVHLRYPGLEVTPSLDRVISDDAVDAAIVATPAQTHYELTLPLLRSGRHVFVEKPLATVLRDGIAMAAAAQEYGRILMVGHLFLHDPAMQAAIKLVRGGAVGDLRYITSVRVSMSGTARLDTGITWDALIHDAYLLPALVGHPPRRVRALGGAYLSSFEDIVFAEFDFGDGVLATCHASWYGLKKERRLAVVGSEAMIEVDGLSADPVLLHHRKYVRSGDTDSSGRHRWHWSDTGSELQEMSSAEPLRHECADFIRCIREGRRPVAGGHEGVEAIGIVQACQASLESDGAWVRIALG